MYDALLSMINAPEKSEYSTGLTQQLAIYLGYLHLYYFSDRNETVILNVKYEALYRQLSQPCASNLRNVSQLSSFRRNVSCEPLQLLVGLKHKLFNGTLVGANDELDLVKRIHCDHVAFKPGENLEQGSDNERVQQGARTLNEAEGGCRDKDGVSSSRDKGFWTTLELSSDVLESLTATQPAAECDRKIHLLIDERTTEHALDELGGC
ncbi:hypothetical protein DXG03_006922 [Asterophora parasitica]|uniref:Uncharacterized protein n=1 Tax=Asterophora parasitica TaxID=117018 RepID=A0A9P7GAE3_9AGAR|nr:hypothetical protein DXG03_006922 [Asterophora parasitica]